MNSSNDKYIVSALSSGFNETQIAQALGVSVSAVSMHISERNLMEEVRKISPFAKIDDDLNQLEGKILGKINRRIDSEILTLPQLTGMLRVINNAKRRSISEGQPDTIVNQRFVQLNLSPQARARVTVSRNHNNEIVEVNGQSLETMPSGRLIEQVSEDEKQLPSPPKQISDYI